MTTKTTSQYETRLAILKDHDDRIADLKRDLTSTINDLVAAVDRAHEAHRDGFAIATSVCGGSFLISDAAKVEAANSAYLAAIRAREAIAYATQKVIDA